MTCLKQVVDAKKASYGVENATYAVVQLAQTTMRSELGKITLDKTFEERATLNLNIVESIRFVTEHLARPLLRYSLQLLHLVLHGLDRHCGPSNAHLQSCMLIIPSFCATCPTSVQQTHPAMRQALCSSWQSIPGFLKPSTC